VQGRGAEYVLMTVIKLVYSQKMRGGSIVLEEVQLLLDQHFCQHDQVLLVSVKIREAGADRC